MYICMYVGMVNADLTCRRIYRFAVKDWIRRVCRAVSVCKIDLPQRVDRADAFGLSFVNGLESFRFEETETETEIRHCRGLVDLNARETVALRNLR